MTLEELRHEVAEKKRLLKRLQARNFEEEERATFNSNWEVLQHLSHGSEGSHGEEKLTPEQEH